MRADLADRLAKNWDMHVQPAQRPCYDETRAATYIEAECSYDDVRSLPLARRDVADALRCRRTPASTHFNWPRGAHACLKDGGVQFDVTCEALRARSFRSRRPHGHCSALRGLGTRCLLA